MIDFKVNENYNEKFITKKVTNENKYLNTYLCVTIIFDTMMVTDLHIELYG